MSHPVSRTQFSRCPRAAFPLLALVTLAACSSDSGGLVLKTGDSVVIALVGEDGAELKLEVTNHSSVDWPALASIVPCLSAGNAHVRGAPDEGFFDPKHKNTYYLGPDGLELLIDREIHFNKRLSTLLEEYSPPGRYEFSFKWPTSDRQAEAGIVSRESEDRQWVTGIAWNRFLAAQGHDPLKCMHLSVHV